METEKDLDSVKLAIDARVSFVEKNIFEIKRNIQELENIGLIILTVSVVASGSLYLQISNLSRDIAELDLHFNHSISELLDRNEIIPKDLKNIKTCVSGISSRLDSIINISNANKNNENPK